MTVVNSTLTLTGYCHFCGAATDKRFCNRSHNIMYHAALRQKPVTLIPCPICSTQHRPGAYRLHADAHVRRGEMVRREVRLDTSLPNTTRFVYAVKP